MGLFPDGRSARERGDIASAAPRIVSGGHVGPGFPRGYWAIFCANTLRGLTMYAILVHQVAYLVDVGFSRMVAASYYSTSAFLSIPGGLAAGAISDRIGRTRTYAGLAFLFAVGYVSLLLTRDPPTNRAYHPYCYYNPTYDCPYPPPENRLKVAIRVGERMKD